MKKALILTWLFFLLGIIASIFWYNSWVYSLPTPIPSNYVSVEMGRTIKLSDTLNKLSNKPLFLHFFNPDCPCSRFNIKNFSWLVNKYGRQINFVVVVMNNNYYTARQIQDKFDLNIPVLFNSKLAVACGVYSTPQAVLLDDKQKLYFRGNYNSSRYCNDQKTNYAKIAIDGLLNNRYNLVFDPLALRAYGCKLPGCAN